MLLSQALISARTPSSTRNWDFIGQLDYSQWQCELGENMIFCQAYSFNGVALYARRPDCNAPAPGNHLLPGLFEWGQADGLPCMSYSCVGNDLFTCNVRDH